jgi:hypothetical protein
MRNFGEFSEISSTTAQDDSQAVAKRGPKGQLSAQRRPIPSRQSSPPTMMKNRTIYTRSIAISPQGIVKNRNIPTRSIDISRSE